MTPQTFLGHPELQSLALDWVRNTKNEVWKTMVINILKRLHVAPAVLYTAFIVTDRLINCLFSSRICSSSLVYAIRAKQIKYLQFPGRITQKFKQIWKLQKQRSWKKVIFANVWSNSIEGLLPTVLPDIFLIMRKLCDLRSHSQNEQIALSFFWERRFHVPIILQLSLSSP